MKRVGAFSTIISIFLLYVPLCFASNSSDIISAPLKGIKEMWVGVQELDPKATAIGLTVERIKTVVELKLRREGIKILDKQTLAPILGIYIGVVGVAFSIIVYVEEGAQLERDRSITTLATTWEGHTTGTHGGDAEYIIGSLQGLLDNFLNDSYKENPKK